MGTPWPPPQYQPALDAYAHYDALYRGAFEEETQPATHYVNGRPHRGGLDGLMYRLKHGQPLGDDAGSDMHIPLAADLAQLSSKLLFAAAPKTELPRENEKQPHPNQDRLDQIMSSDEAHSELLRWGEYMAVHGGGYLALAWDASLVDHVFIRAYRADCALPVFRHGRLAEVTFWTDYVIDSSKVYRLLEKHVPGTITYSLWRGTSGDKGVQVPLDEIDDSAHYTNLKGADRTRLPEAQTLDTVVATGVPWLTVEYAPNMLPNPIWDREGGVNANLGRSDFFQLEPLFEKADFIWGSLIRDFDNGLGRVAVPESWLETGLRGEGGKFDSRTQYYTAMGGDIGKDANDNAVISQFAIRDQEHFRALREVKKQIAQSAGYSPSSFGVHEQSSNRTATEVNDDRSDSEATRDQKSLYARPAIARIARTALAIDSLVFPGKGGAVLGELPNVIFAELSQVDPLQNAQAISLLAAAKSLSIRQRVELASPQLDSADVDTVVETIYREENIGPAADPADDRRGEFPQEEVPDA